MVVHLHFSETEMISFLTALGYLCEWSHVDMFYGSEREHKAVRVMGVKDAQGRDYCKPGGPNFSKEDWLRTAFTEALCKRMMEGLIPPKNE